MDTRKESVWAEMLVYWLDLWKEAQKGSCSVSMTDNQKVEQLVKRKVNLMDSITVAPMVW
jgi:hypothetical protein